MTDNMREWVSDTLQSIKKFNVQPEAVTSACRRGSGSILIITTLR